MIRPLAIAIAALVALGNDARAFEPLLPLAATATASEAELAGSVALPTGPWVAGNVPILDAKGAVLRQVWRIPESGATPLQMIDPIRAQLVEAGYDILYECRDRDCGGFDFRFALDLIPAPDMYVDLGNYRYLLAEDPADDGHVAIVTSRSTGAAFVHMTWVTPSPVTTAPVSPPVRAPVVSATAPKGIATMLESEGYAILDGITFASGSSSLDDRDYPELETLARYLAENPGARIALVGHTDAVGSLEANQRLSSARANAVREQLRDTYGVAPERVIAQGVGYLAPRSSNLTEDGRTLNRRVEVVLLPAP